MATKKPSTRKRSETTKARAKAPEKRRGRSAGGLQEADFTELMQSVHDMKAYLRGEPTASRVTDVRAGGEDAAPDVAAIRATMGLSQADFATLLGISRRTLEGWEQGRRAPDGPARALLRVAAKHPHAVLDAAAS